MNFIFKTESNIHLSLCISLHHAYQIWKKFYVYLPTTYLWICMLKSFFDEKSIKKLTIIINSNGKYWDHVIYIITSCLFCFLDVEVVFHFGDLIKWWLKSMSWMSNRRLAISLSKIFLVALKISKKYFKYFCIKYGMFEYIHISRKFFFILRVI